MTDQISPKPPWTERLLAVLLYFGLAPCMWRACLRDDRRFLRVHFVQSLIVALFFVFLLIGYLGLLVWVFDLIHNDPDRFERIRTTTSYRFWVDWVPSILTFLWLALWGSGITLAVLGSSFQFPGFGWLSRRKWAMYGAFATGSPFYLGLLVLVVLTLHASSLTDGRVRPASAYMLYDDLGYVPKWVFDVGFYRVSKAAKRKWGRGEVVVAPISREAIDTALQNGRFVFLATHGGGGRIDTGKLVFGPEDINREHVGDRLQFVYIAACDAGSEARKWRRALAPTEVFTYDRDSYVEEHVRWLWTKGPKKIRELK